MVIYIPQNIDPYNTHLKNLIDAYTLRGIEVLTGYDFFISGKSIPDVIHFHQVEGLIWYIKFNQDLFFERLEFFKSQGVIILATAHNLKPHYSTGRINFMDFFNRYFGYIDMVINHGKKSVDILKEEFPVLKNKKHLVCHHGDYMNDMSGFHETKESARKILKLSAGKKIILVFGQLQFKNSGFAGEVFIRIKKKYLNSVLLLAGVKPVFRINRLNKLYYLLNNNILNSFRKNRIMIHKRFSQYETYLLFTASDVVFLPHNEGLTTGNIPMAATLGKPFVYPDIGVFAEQAEDCFAEKYECGNVNDAVNAVDNILSSGLSFFDNTAWLKKNSWAEHVNSILINLPESSIK